MCGCGDYNQAACKREVVKTALKAVQAVETWLLLHRLSSGDTVHAGFRVTDLDQEQSNNLLSQTQNVIDVHADCCSMLALGADSSGVICYCNYLQMGITAAVGNRPALILLQQPTGGKNAVLQDKSLKNRQLQITQRVDIYATFSQQDAWS